MQTLQIDKNNALKLFPSASTEFKQMLIDTFGEKFFQQKITDRIKTFEDACLETGEDPNHSKFSTGTSDEIAYKKLKVIVRALNEGWLPDYNSSNQRKWYPWFQYSGSGFRFGDSVCGGDYSFVGSRLCYVSEELAIYAAKQFETEYNQFLK